MMRSSKLAKHPKSKLIETGYVNIYSELTPQEKRQIFYNREYKKINPQWDNTMIFLCKQFEDAIKKSNSSKKTESLVVLDVGCGNGNYVIDEYRRNITWACGIDVDRNATSKNICLDEIKYTNGLKIPYSDNTFDVVLSLWVMEHLKNPEIVLKEIYRVLSPEGFFIFATPNKYCFPLLAKQIINNHKLVSYVNKTLYGRADNDIYPTFYKANSLKELDGLLKDVGFKVIILELNYDPGYTSINTMSFRISNALNSFFEKVAPQVYKHHIIGIARKEK